MSDAENVLKAIVRQVVALIRPLVAAGEQPDLFRLALAEQGWDLSELGGDAVDKLLKASEGLHATLSKLEDGFDARDFDSLLKTLKATGEAIDELRKLASTFDAAALPDAVGSAFGLDFLDLLVRSYLEESSPIAYQMMRMLTLIDSEVPDEIRIARGGNDVVLRSPIVRERLRLDHLGELLRDPGAHFSKLYTDTGGFNTSQDAEIFVQRFFGNLRALVRLFNGSVALNLGLEPLNDAHKRTVDIGIPLLVDDTVVEAGVVIEVVPAESDGPGVRLWPRGAAEFKHVQDDWGFRITAAAASGWFFITKDGIESSQNDAKFEAEFELTKGAQGKPAAVFGTDDGTRLELGRLITGAHVGVRDGKADFGARVATEKSAFVISAGDGDGFLQYVLPPDGIRTDFDLGVGWSRRKGVYVSGGATLAVEIPVNQSILDVIDIDSVYLEVGVKAEEGKKVELPVTVAITGGLELGPFAAVVERVGLTATATFPKDGGNLGPIHVELGFKPPDGLGMSIDAPAISGGGFLSFDHDKGRYAGILQLSFLNIGVTAIGLVATKMPDGSPGFSLLLIITADFPPIQLGYGFTLNALGGLIGANRTVSIPDLQDAVARGGVDSIMFPDDPIRNASRIISDLRSFFPIAKDRYVFGPMIELGWGTPSQVTGQLALIIEVPLPIRIILLGQLQVTLPAIPGVDEIAIVKLRLDLLGIIDFETGLLSFDASLIDSRILVFMLEGDAAMRLNWLGEPNFALAVGGLHPRVTPPPGFPKLRRMSLSMSFGENARLRLECYLGFTANTFQLGAGVDALLKIGEFEASGGFSFDALIQFEPFKFVAGMRAWVRIRFAGETLLAVELALNLSGPNNWVADGKANFKIAGLKYNVKFKETFGEKKKLGPVERVDLLKRVHKALESPRSWTGSLPNTDTAPVSLRDIEGLEPETLVVHPLGNLSLRQKEAPLGLKVDLVGTAKPKKDRRIRITKGWIGDDKVTELGELRDKFAPAQFFKMSDSDKLSLTAFESYQSGVTLTPGKVLLGDSIGGKVGYEEIVYDRDVPHPPAPADADKKLAIQWLSEDRLAWGLRRRATAASPFRASRARRFHAEPIKVGLSEVEYRVQSLDGVTKGLDEADWSTASAGGAALAGGGGAALFAQLAQLAEEKGGAEFTQKMTIAPLYERDGDSR